MKLLRAVEPEDLDLMYIIENDITLWRHGSATAPYSRYSLHQYLSTTQNDIYKDSQVRFAIDHCGFLDITDFNPQHRRASIGIILTPESQGQGLATRALHEAHSYSRTVGIHQLWAVVATDNTPARHLFERCGYQKIATLPQWLIVDGNYTDAHLYSLIL